MTCQTVKQDTCVLTPKEYRRIREQLPSNTKYREMCDVALQTGLRMENEFWPFLEHPEWYKPDKRCIDLPKTYTDKKGKERKTATKLKCRMKERSVFLTPKGCEDVAALIRNPPDHISRKSWGAALKKAAIAAGVGDEHICPKMFRKSITSWLTACFPEKVLFIAYSMGHTQKVMTENYLNPRFADDAMLDIREFTRGWMT